MKDGSAETIIVGQEKGIDVRIALDVMRFAWDDVYDVALIFSQDQDLSEVADEVRRFAHFQSRWIKIASAFPVGNKVTSKIGIDKTDWIKIDKSTYDLCLDQIDYRL
ncbi:MAG: NYN domain-containing protein [Candidatus Aminicenantes bacterium]|nr:NYN domain-containing protein [Candidatus Aminicenantes bacterium]